MPYKSNTNDLLKNVILHQYLLIYWTLDQYCIGIVRYTNTGYVLVLYLVSEVLYSVYLGNSILVYNTVSGIGSNRAIQYQYL